MNKQEFLNNLKKVQKNKYGEYIYIGADNIPTGCWKGMEEYTWLQEYEQQNTNKVTEYIEYKEPTEEEYFNSMTIKGQSDYIRNKRDNLINKADVLLLKYQEQVELGVVEQDDTYRLAMLQYKEDLRNVPEQAGFPMNVVWPEIPARK